MNEHPRDLAQTAPHQPVRIGAVRLPARLPFDLRARGRGPRRPHHRPRARRRGQRLHGRRDLRQGRALCRARAPSRPPAAAAAPQGRQGHGRVRADLAGTTRSIIVAERSLRAEQRHGAEAVWPYYYAGTMGLVMRDGINRLRHAKKYSGFHSTICVNPAWTGFAAGTGQLAGPDPREMAKSDLVVIWGTNAVNTQVNVMTHAIARPQGARRQDRRRRRLHERHHGAGRPAGADPARHRRRARLRGDALPVPRRPRRPRLSRALHRRAARARSACAHALRRNGRRASPAATVATIEAFARLVGETQARLFPARLRLFPLAQRRRQHACGELHSGGDRRLAVRRRRRVPQQRRHLPLEQDDDRRARRARSVGAHARPVAHRRDPRRRRRTRSPAGRR